MEFHLILKARINHVSLKFDLDLIQMTDKEKKELYKHVKIKAGVVKFDEFTQELQSKLHNDLISLND